MRTNAQKQVSFVSTIWPFTIRYWRRIFVGFLLGAVLGFTSSTVNHIAPKFGENALKIINTYLSGVTVWPKRGLATILAIVSVAALLYGFRAIAFLKRFWRSWRSGLVSGVGEIWFVTSGATFAFFNLTGSYRSLLLLGIGVVGTALVCYRDFRVGEKAEERFEADPDRPIEEADEDILNRGTVVAGIVRLREPMATAKHPFSICCQRNSSSVRTSFSSGFPRGFPWTTRRLFQPFSVASWKNSKQSYSSRRLRKTL